MKGSSILLEECKGKNWGKKVNFQRIEKILQFKLSLLHQSLHFWIQIHFLHIFFKFRLQCINFLKTFLASASKRIRGNLTKGNKHREAKWYQIFKPIIWQFSTFKNQLMRTSVSHISLSISQTILREKIMLSIYRIYTEEGMEGMISRRHLFGLEPLWVEAIRRKRHSTPCYRIILKQYENN